jgi:hypothetical protein
MPDTAIELAAELLGWCNRVRERVEIGNVASVAKFERRLQVDHAILRRVIDRDQRWARELDAAAAREAEQS